MSLLLWQHFIVFLCMRISLSDGILTSQIDFTTLKSKVEFVLFSPYSICYAFTMHVTWLNFPQLWVQWIWTFTDQNRLLSSFSFSLFHQTYRCLLKLNKLTRPEPYVWNWLGLRWIKTLFTRTTKSDQMQSRFCNSFYALLK